MSEKVNVLVDVSGNVGVSYTRYHVEDSSVGTITSGEIAGWFEESRVGVEPDRDPATVIIPLQSFEQIDKY